MGWANVSHQGALFIGFGRGGAGSSHIARHSRRFNVKRQQECRQSAEGNIQALLLTILFSSARFACFKNVKLRRNAVCSEKGLGGTEEQKTRQV